MLGSLEDVIQYVRTPLALAALVLVAGAPIVHRIVSRKRAPNKDTQAVLRYGFVLGLVFGVLAIVAFTYTSSFQREIRISGTVRDEHGAGLGFATVRIAGRDGGIADADGNFAFTVPDSRAAERYVLDVFLEGYELLHHEVRGRYPDPASVTLRTATVVVAQVMTLPPSMILRHNLGIPQVEIAITFRNPVPRSTSLTDISLTLHTPSGAPIPLLMEGMSVVPGQYGPPLPMWRLEKGASNVITYSFFNSVPRFSELHQKVYAELTQQQPIPSEADPDATLLSPKLVQQLRDFMKSQFIWAPGKWTLKAACTLEGRIFDAKGTFVLSDDDIARMRAIANYYPSALGVAPGWRFWNSDTANPTVNVTLSTN